MKLISTGRQQLTSRHWLAQHIIAVYPMKYAPDSYSLRYDIIMGTIASLITSLTIVYSTVYSDADQRKHQSSTSLAFVWGIHRGPVNSPHKWPVTQNIWWRHRVLLRFIVVWYWSILPISFSVASLALGQSYDCPSASEVTLNDMDEYITWIC